MQTKKKRKQLYKKINFTTYLNLQCHTTCHMFKIANSKIIVNIEYSRVIVKKV